MNLIISFWLMFFSVLTYASQVQTESPCIEQAQRPIVENLTTVRLSNHVRNIVGQLSELSSTEEKMTLLKPLDQLALDAATVAAECGDLSVRTHTVYVTLLKSMNRSLTSLKKSSSFEGETARKVLNDLDSLALELYFLLF